MKVMKTYKFKLYNSKKNKHLEAAIEIASEVWNYCIALERRYYKAYGKYLSANRLKTHLTKVKKRTKYAHWRNLGSQAIQDVVERMDRSYDAFFTHVKEGRGGRKSPPRFRKRKKYNSFTLKQAGYKFHDGNHVTIMGQDYKYFAHRPIEGTIKTLTVKRTTHGAVFIFVVCEQTLPEIHPRTGDAVGLDFGLKSFLTFDDGTTVESPEWFKHSLSEVRSANRAVSRCKKGSNNRRRALAAQSRTHEHIANKRRDWFFKLANELCSRYAVICIEDLNLKAMQMMWGRKVNDIAFAEFVGILEWKAVATGTRLVKVDRWAPTTKRCHCCGSVVPPMPLSCREWDCPSCGHHHDRDVNAAINIRTLGLDMAV